MSEFVYFTFYPKINFANDKVQGSKKMKAKLFLYFTTKIYTWLFSLILLPIKLIELAHK